MAVQNLVPQRVVNLASAPSSPEKGWIYFNTTDDTLYWYDGTAWVSAEGSGGPTAWTALPFNTGWGNRGSGWAPGEYRKVGDIVYLRGSVTKSTAPATGDVIATLPAGFRAPDDYAFLFNTETTTLGRIVIRPTGDIELRASTTSGGSADFIRLEQIFYSIT